MWRIVHSLAVLCFSVSCTVSDRQGLRVQSAERTDAGSADAHVSDGSESTDAQQARQTRCGDGVVSGVERCDTAIERGLPGACPLECPAVERCVPRVLNGTGCQSECLLRQLTCESGDGCCPGNCTKDTDQDCSTRCGDGIVQTTSGETCEPGTATPCPTSCENREACFIEKLTGSESTCNAACLPEAVTAIGPDDACCPEGSNAKTDPNCEARCGNGVQEGAEACDGSDDCDSSCKLTTDSAACTASARDECERCVCEQCAVTELACRFGSNNNENRLCGDIVACTRSNSCIGTPCYCGDAPACRVPSGPCRAEHEAAGGSPLQLSSMVGDPGTIIGRAYAADSCRVTQCAEACSPD